MKPILITVLALALSGCTTNATKLAIQDFRKSEEFKELAFNNASRVAEDQMLLNLNQYIQAHPTDLVKIFQAISATWEARNQLEISRRQFLMSQSLSQISVGQYLYDQQGFLNVWFGDKATTAGQASASAQAADKAAGVNSFMDLVPKVDSTTRPTSGPSSFQDILKAITNKK